MPVEVLAQANNLSPSAALQLGQSITIPSSKQVQRLEREAAAAEQAREKKRQQEEALAKKSADAKREAQQKLSEARKEVKETDAKGSFGVQVALANDQAKADELAKKFRAAGYQVKTSATSRGVRVVVGPERGKVAALALKDKINSDPKVNTTSAWVLYWR
ncbi:SPOR domain-containing protein [Psychrobacter sp. JCM 18901]|uniref:SPOR domain-containing protein n=2 Tax=Psychrobacter TaxID=497 RepID=UPI0021C2C0CE|nr:SPOR domain-containing protein [Psychrobacter sp. JCM 18901]